MKHLFYNEPQGLSVVAADGCVRAQPPTLILRKTAHKEERPGLSTMGHHWHFKRLRKRWCRPTWSCHLDLQREVKLLFPGCSKGKSVVNHIQIQFWRHGFSLFVYTQERILFLNCKEAFMSTNWAHLTQVRSRFLRVPWRQVKTSLMMCLPHRTKMSIHPGFLKIFATKFPTRSIYVATATACSIKLVKPPAGIATAWPASTGSSGKTISFKNNSLSYD